MKVSREIKQLNINGTIINYEVIDKYDRLHYDDTPYYEDLLNNCVIQGIISIVFFDGHLDMLDAAECNIKEGMERLKNLYPQHLIVYTRNLEYDVGDHDLIDDFCFNIDKGSIFLPFPYNRYHRYIYNEDHQDFDIYDIITSATIGRIEEAKRRINDILQHPISLEIKVYLEEYLKFLENTSYSMHKWR